MISYQYQVFFSFEKFTILFEVSIIEIQFYIKRQQNKNMDPRPFHFDYRPAPQNVSPTYFSDRLYNYLQPEQQNVTGSSRYLRDNKNSRLSSPASSLKSNYFDKDKNDKEIDSLVQCKSQKSRENGYENNKISYFRRNLENQLNSFTENKQSREQRRHGSLDQFPRNQNKIFPLESTEKEERSTGTSHKAYESSQIVGQYNENYNNYRLKLLPKSRYDPVAGGQFIDNRKILEKLNSLARPTYSGDALEMQVQKNQKMKMNSGNFEDIGGMGDTTTAPTNSRPKGNQISKQMMGDFYKKYMNDQRYIQQKNQRQYNIINGNQWSFESEKNSRQNSSDNSRNRKSGISGISGFSSMKTKYLPMGRRQGFRRLGVKK